MFWCFHCYGINDQPRGPCVHCGQPIEEPLGLSHQDRLVWALGHPDADRAIVAAQLLGRIGDRSVAPTLRRVVAESSDVFLAAEALRSLVTLLGAEELAPTLKALAKDGTAPVRKVARHVLEHEAGGSGGGYLASGGHEEREGGELGDQGEGHYQG
jgi:hypothetical protein